MTSRGTRTVSRILPCAPPSIRFWRATSRLSLGRFPNAIKTALSGSSNNSGKTALSRNARRKVLAYRAHSDCLIKWPC